MDQVVGVPPAIALEQRTTRSGANSTVATVTEVAHYLRLLFAKVGAIHCPSCEALVETTSPDELFARLRGEFLRRVAQRGMAPEVWIAAGDPVGAHSPLGLLARWIRRAGALHDGDTRLVEPGQQAAQHVLAIAERVLVGTGGVIVLGVGQAPVRRYHQGTRLEKRGRDANGGMQQAAGQSAEPGREYGVHAIGHAGAQQEFAEKNAALSLFLRMARPMNPCSASSNSRRSEIRTSVGILVWISPMAWKL